MLSILAKQNKQPRPARQGLRHDPPAARRERDHIAGFIRNASTAGQAAAERRTDIVQGLKDFPTALQQLTADDGPAPQLRRRPPRPVATDLRRRGPVPDQGDRARSARFAKCGKPALTTLGTAAQQSLAPTSLASRWPDQRPRHARLEERRRAQQALDKLLTTLRKTDGIDYLTRRSSTRSRRSTASTATATTCVARSRSPTASSTCTRRPSPAASRTGPAADGSSSASALSGHAAINGYTPRSISSRRHRMTTTGATRRHRGRRQHSARPPTVDDKTDGNAAGAAGKRPTEQAAEGSARLSYGETVNEARAAPSIRRSATRR